MNAYLKKKILLISGPPGLKSCVRPCQRPLPFLALHRSTRHLEGLEYTFRWTGIYYKDFMDLLWHLIFMQHMGTELLELTVMTAWSIWFSRNKTRMGATCQTSHEIMAKARFLLMEYQEAHLRPTQFKDATDKR